MSYRFNEKSLQYAGRLVFTAFSFEKERLLDSVHHLQFIISYHYRQNDFLMHFVWTFLVCVLLFSNRCEQILMSSGRKCGGNYRITSDFPQQD